MKKTKFEVVIPIYGTAFTYITGVKEHAKFLTSVGLDPKDAEGYIGMVYSSNDNALCMFIDQPSDLKTIHHECIHAAFRILEHVDIKADKDNQEALCYLSDWIFDWIINNTNFKFKKIK